jgi:DNA polymerase I
MRRVKTIHIYDGSNLLHTHFHAHPLTLEGRRVGGIYGLIKTIISSYNPHIHTNVVVFDYDRKSNFRVLLDPSYKANRGEPDPDLSYNFEYAILILKSLGIRVYIKEGYEADDVIGSLATIWSAHGYKIKIFSQDKDFIQLLSPLISMVSKNRILTIDNWEQHISVPPWKFRDYLAICGDASDNIKGIKGIGPVGAAVLLQEYGDIKTLYHMLENDKSKFKPTLLKKLEEGKEAIKLSQKLVTIVCDIHDLNTSISQEDIPDYKLALDQLKDLRMYTLASKLRLVQQKEEKLVQLGVEADEHIASIEYSNIPNMVCSGIPVTYMRTSNNFQISTSLALSYVIHSVDEVTDVLRYSSNVITYDVKNELKYFAHQGWILGNLKWDDIHLMCYLIHGHQTPAALEDVLHIYASVLHPYIDDTESSSDTLTTSILILYSILSKKLDDMNLKQLYTIELRLMHLLHSMEIKGIRVHKDRLNAKAIEVKLQLLKIEKDCYDLAGIKFNILSSKEAHSILIGVFKLPVAKSISAPALRKLKHPMADLIIKYREHAKIINTYTNSLIDQLDADDRLHTTYSQTTAYTGRLSSSSPNLQNIPRKFDLRKCFIPSDGYRLVSLDFSQIELKVAAHLSNDTKLLNAFSQGLDVHTETARAIFKVEVTPELRDIAKRINFGILYGIGPQGLSNYIDKSVQECEDIITTFFSNYIELKAYFEQLKEEGLQKGYVTTILNRRIYLPNLNSQSNVLRKAAERNAINSPIQGSAADIMKIAMLDVDAYITNHNLDARILLQIHDEIVLEISDTLMQHLPKLQEVMCKAYILSVPLTCSIDRDKWGHL